MLLVSIVGTNTFYFELICIHNLSKGLIVYYNAPLET